MKASESSFFCLHKSYPLNYVTLYIFPRSAAHTHTHTPLQRLHVPPRENHPSSLESHCCKYKAAKTNNYSVVVFHSCDVYVHALGGFAQTNNMHQV